MTGPAYTYREIQPPLMIDAWLRDALPGERMEYYRGFLSPDSLQTSNDYARSKPGRRMTFADRSRLAALAAHVRDLMAEGAVILVQKRHDALDYSYLLVKVRRPAPVTDPWRGMPFDEREL